MRTYHLPKPTEADHQREVEIFMDANHCYHDMHIICILKRKGVLKTSHTLAEAQRDLYLIGLDAYHKIPTLWLVELREMLNQIHVTV